MNHSQQSSFSVRELVLLNILLNTLLCKDKLYIKKCNNLKDQNLQFPNPWGQGQEIA